MKKILSAILVMLPFVSCRTWDLITPDVCIVVRNHDGENLLDPNVNGNILSNDITVEYDGETYSIPGLETRENMAFWYGLRIEPRSSKDDTPVLKFGEFQTTSGSDSYRGETFTINWGDGTSDEVKFDLFVRGTHNVIEKIWLNGELQSDNSLDVTIVK